MLNEIETENKENEENENQTRGFFIRHISTDQEMPTSILSRIRKFSKSFSKIKDYVISPENSETKSTSCQNISESLLSEVENKIETNIGIERLQK